MRVLYHFRYSPFSRRVRLALANKRLDVELREARDNPDWRAEAARMVPLRTIPVLVDGGHALGDSTAITRWLDVAYPSAPRLWANDGGSAASPEAGRGSDEDALHALEVATLVDVVLCNVVDLGTRYFALSDHASWPSVKDEMLGRARLAADGLAARVTRASSLGRTTISRSGWSAPDMWLYTMVAWFEGLPGRAASGGTPAQVMSLGFSVPGVLTAWADAHRGRDDVAAL